MRRILTILTLLGSLFFAADTFAATTSVNLGWSPSAGTNVAGYDIYYGTSSGNYITAVPVSNVTNVTIRGLTSGTTYYFAATSFDKSGNQSAFSPEISYTVGSSQSVAATLTPLVSAAGKGFSFAITGTAGTQYVVQGSTDLVHWVALQTNVAPFNFTDSNSSQFPRRFYRTAYVAN